MGKYKCCPFCGSTDIELQDDIYNEPDTMMQVVCNSCGAGTRCELRPYSGDHVQAPGDCDYDMTAESLADRWNMRGQSCDRAESVIALSERIIELSEPLLNGIGSKGLAKALDEIKAQIVDLKNQIRRESHVNTTTDRPVDSGGSSGTERREDEPGAHTCRITRDRTADSGGPSGEDEPVAGRGIRIDGITTTPIIQAVHVRPGSGPRSLVEPDSVPMPEPEPESAPVSEPASESEVCTYRPPNLHRWYSEGSYDRPAMPQMDRELLRSIEQSQEILNSFGTGPVELPF